MSNNNISAIKFAVNDNERYRKYLNKGLEIYQNLKSLSSRDLYKKLVNEIECGNEDARFELADRSIYHVVEAVADVYARYDIEDRLPFEDGLTLAIDNYSKYVMTTENFPKYVSVYLNQVISLYAFRTIMNAYVISKKPHSVPADLMTNEQIAYCLDKINNEEFQEGVTFEQLQKTLFKLLDKLSPKHREILVLKFGLNGEKPLTNQAIGEIYNVGSTRIDQIVKASLEKFRKPKNIKKIETYNDYQF